MNVYNVYNVPSVHKTSFPHYIVKTQASPIWNFHHRYKYDIIQSTGQPRARIFFLNSFTRNVLFPDVGMFYFLTMFRCLGSQFSSFEAFLTMKLKNNCLQVFTIALSLPEILLQVCLNCVTKLFRSLNAFRSKLSEVLFFLSLLSTLFPLIVP